jgi:acyl carrier protein
MNHEQIRLILANVGKLAIDPGQLDEDADLYDAGLTSLNTVSVMLALEDEYNVEFEESMLNRSTFQSIGALADALEQLLN